MKTICAEDFCLLKEKNLTVVFVNTSQKPHKSIPNDCYKYTVFNRNEYRFWRLYTEVYIYDDIVEYSVLIWRPIEVKPHCIQSIMNYIDGGKALKELILGGE